MLPPRESLDPRSDTAQVGLVQQVDGESECRKVIDQERSFETSLSKGSFGDLPSPVGEARGAGHDRACHGNRSQPRQRGSPRRDRGSCAEPR